MVMEDILLMKEERGHLMTSMRFFREVMCSTEYSIEQKDSAFENLVTDFIRTIYKMDADKNLFEALTIEWERRRLYEAMRVHKGIFSCKP